MPQPRPLQLPPERPRQCSRRSFLQLAGALSTGAALLAACSSSPTAPPATSAKPTDGVPKPPAPVGTARGTVSPAVIAPPVAASPVASPGASLSPAAMRVASSGVSANADKGSRKHSQTISRRSTRHLQVGKTGGQGEAHPPIKRTPWIRLCRSTGVAPLGGSGVSRYGGVTSSRARPSCPCSRG